MFSYIELFTISVWSSFKDNKSFLWGLLVCLVFFFFHFCFLSREGFCVEKVRNCCAGLWRLFRGVKIKTFVFLKNVLFICISDWKYIHTFFDNSYYWYVESISFLLEPGQDLRLFQIIVCQSDTCDTVSQETTRLPSYLLLELCFWDICFQSLESTSKKSD